MNWRKLSLDKLFANIIQTTQDHLPEKVLVTRAPATACWLRFHFGFSRFTLILLNPHTYSIVPFFFLFRDVQAKIQDVIIAYKRHRFRMYCVPFNYERSAKAFHETLFQFYPGIPGSWAPHVYMALNNLLTYPMSICAAELLRVTRLKTHLRSTI